MGSGQAARHARGVIPTPRGASRGIGRARPPRPPCRSRSPPRPQSPPTPPRRPSLQHPAVIQLRMKRQYPNPHARSFPNPPTLAAHLPGLGQRPLFSRPRNKAKTTHKYSKHGSWNGLEKGRFVRDGCVWGRDVLLLGYLFKGVTRFRQGMSGPRLRAGDDRWPRKTSIKT